LRWPVLLGLQSLSGLPRYPRLLIFAFATVLDQDRQSLPTIASCIVSAYDACLTPHQFIVVWASELDPAAILPHQLPPLPHRRNAHLYHRRRPRI
jgi:hypothetical protein